MQSNLSSHSAFLSQFVFWLRSSEQWQPPTQSSHFWPFGNSITKEAAIFLTLNVWALINQSDRIFTKCGQVHSDPLSLWPCLHFVLRSNERQRNLSNFTLSSLKGSVNCYVTWVLCKVCCPHLHFPKHILFLPSVQVCQPSARP